MVSGAAQTLGAAKIRGRVKRERRFIFPFVAFSTSLRQFLQTSIFWFVGFRPNTVCCVREQSSAVGSALFGVRAPAGGSSGTSRSAGPAIRVRRCECFPVLASLSGPFGGSKRTVPLAPERRQGRRLLAPDRVPNVSRSAPMARRMLIDASHPEETRVVVVDGTKLTEFDFETASRKPAQGQHLPRQGHPHRAVAAGRLRRVRRQPPRLPGLLRNPSRLLPDPGRRPRAAARRAAGAGRRGRRPAPSRPSAVAINGTNATIATNADDEEAPEALEAEAAAPETDDAPTTEVAEAVPAEAAAPPVDPIGEVIPANEPEPPVQEAQPAAIPVESLAGPAEPTVIEGVIERFVLRDGDRRGSSAGGSRRAVAGRRAGRGAGRRRMPARSARSASAAAASRSGSTRSRKSSSAGRSCWCRSSRKSAATRARR